MFHTAGYHAYAQGSGEGEAYLVVVGDRRRGLAWPYLLRAVADVAELAGSDATDVTSVYGYPGPLAWGCTPGDQFPARAWSEVRAVWREQGAVAAFTRFHPLLDNASLLSGVSWPAELCDGPGPVVAAGLTVSVDCTLGDEATRAGYGESHRREIDASHRSGLITLEDEDWTETATFARLYRETMVRSGASEYYLWDKADFERLRGALSGNLHLLVTLSGNAVAAAGLFTEFEGIVQWYLAGSSEAFRARSPTKVLVDDAIRWARERGNSVLHLGGGRGGHEDSLLWFKGRFSPRRHQFYTGRWVLDLPEYLALVQARLAGQPGTAISDEGFFPRYRAPVADQAHSRGADERSVG